MKKTHCNAVVIIDNHIYVFYRKVTSAVVNGLSMKRSATARANTIYSKTSLTDHLPKSTTPLYRSLYFGPIEILPVEILTL